MGILSKYTFNGDANDKVGTAHGTVVNGSYKSGVINTALEFPVENNGYAYLGNNFNFTTEDFTFSFLYYIFSFNDSSSTGYVIPFLKDIWNNKGYYLAINATTLLFNTNQTSANQATLASLSLSLNNWYHIVVTRSGSSVQIYVSGNDKTTTPATHINPTTTTNNFYLNTYTSWEQTPPAAIVANTKIDELIVEQRKWLASEVKNKYAYYKGFF